MVLGQFRCHFLISSVKNHAPVNFQDERFIETEVVEEEVVFKMSHRVVKYHLFRNAWGWRLILSGLSCLYDTYHW